MEFSLLHFEWKDVKSIILLSLSTEKYFSVCAASVKMLTRPLTLGIMGDQLRAPFNKTPRGKNCSGKIVEILIHKFGSR